MSSDTMKTARTTFIELAVRCNVLRFGEFTLKSGRISPYFFNAGGFSSGSALATLGRCYADAIVCSDLVPDTLFGPAYKGIPLVATTAVALAEHYRQDLPYTFNRKEVKNHGEGGSLVGAELTGKAVIIDDVMTAGTAVRESVEVINEAGATPHGVVIGLDRCERGQGSRSAVQEAREDLDLTIVSVIDMHDIIAWLETQESYMNFFTPMRAYRDQYGV